MPRRRWDSRSSPGGQLRNDSTSMPSDVADSAGERPQAEVHRPRPAHRRRDARAFRQRPVAEGREHADEVAAGGRADRADARGSIAYFLTCAAARTQRTAASTSSTAAGYGYCGRQPVVHREGDVAERGQLHAVADEVRLVAAPPRAAVHEHDHRPLGGRGGGHVRVERDLFPADAPDTRCRW